MSNFIVKKAAMQDVAAISQIHAASWKEAYKGLVPQAYLDQLKNDFWEAAFTQWIGDKRLEVLLLLDSSTPVGTVAYGKARDERYSSYGEIVSLYVLPSYFGRGVGKELLEASIQELYKMQYKGIYLWVLKENHRARKFYEKNQFMFTGMELLDTIMEQPIIDLCYLYEF